MGKRLGLADAFWPDMDGFWNFLLEGSGVTLEELRAAGRLEGEGTKRQPVPRGYRQCGFPTADGKIHLALPGLEEGSVPRYRPLPAPDEAYPDRCTNYKSPFFFHSAGRQMPGQRTRQPDPVAYVSEDVAAREGLREGDWARITTPTGEARQRVHIGRGMPAGTIALAIGWWDPDAAGARDVLAGNCNNLTSDRTLLGGEIQAFSCRGIPCRVTKEERMD